VEIIRLIYFGVLIIMTMMGAVAGLFLKKSSGFKSVYDLFVNKNFYFGGILYFITSLLNIYILKYIDYSTVLPLTSITYIWTLVLSYVILKEKVGFKKIVGVAGIIFGAILITI
jgi:drug/metabolite transporter (DMT)-like permease